MIRPQQKPFVDGLKLWADAICINQSDLVEKSKTVGRIHELYLTARSVTSRLGMGDEGRITTVEIIRDIVRQGTRAFMDADNWLRTPLLNANTLWNGTTILPALYNLMDLPSWRRLLVIQEISIAAPVGGI
jgi:hypothetical protein